jgi:hypothetical protein
MNFEEPAGTLTHKFYMDNGEVADMSGVVFFRRVDTCTFFAEYSLTQDTNGDTQEGPNPADQSEDPQCYVFRSCYEDYSTAAFLSDSLWSNEIAVSVQKDGSLYWTYVSCYQVLLFPTHTTFLLLYKRFQGENEGGGL